MRNKPWHSLILVWYMKMNHTRERKPQVCLWCYLYAVTTGHVNSNEITINTKLTSDPHQRCASKQQRVARQCVSQSVAHTQVWCSMGRRRSAKHESEIRLRDERVTHAYFISRSRFSSHKHTRLSARAYVYARRWVGTNRSLRWHGSLAKCQSVRMKNGCNLP